VIVDDLAVFYGDDFTVDVTRQRPSAPDLTFRGILGEEDGEALDRRAIALERVLAYPAGTDVLTGDTVLIAAQPYRVRDARRVNDGAESRAWLQKV